MNFFFKLDSVSRPESTRDLAKTFCESVTDKPMNNLQEANVFTPKIRLALLLA